MGKRRQSSTSHHTKESIKKSRRSSLSPGLTVDLSTLESPTVPSTLESPTIISTPKSPTIPSTPVSLIISSTPTSLSIPSTPASLSNSSIPALPTVPSTPGSPTTVSSVTETQLPLPSDDHSIKENVVSYGNKPFFKPRVARRRLTVERVNRDLIDLDLPVSERRCVCNAWPITDMTPDGRNMCFFHDRQRSHPYS